MTRVLELIRQVSNVCLRYATPKLFIMWKVCKKGIHVTKRDLFYTDAKLFTNQLQSDDAIEEAAAMIGCTRSSLNGDFDMHEPFSGSDANL